MNQLKNWESMKKSNIYRLELKKISTNPSKDMVIVGVSGTAKELVEWAQLALWRLELLAQDDVVQDEELNVS